MISGFGELKFRQKYLDIILNISKELNITNPEDIAKADEDCCRDELEEFKKIFKRFPNVDQQLSLDIYEKRIEQEKNELITYFKSKNKNTSNKKATPSEIENLKKSIMDFRKKIKSKRQQCPFCVKSLKKLKFHLFRINIKQKLLGCKYFQEEIARAQDLKKQLELYFQALRYGAPNIKYSFDVIKNPVFEEFKNKTIKTSKDALDFCRFLWRVLVDKRQSDINDRKKIKEEKNKSIFEKEICGSNNYNNIKKEENNAITIYSEKKSDSSSDKSKYDNNLKKNKKNLGNSIKIIEFGASDESSTDNLSLNEMCKKGKMVKYIIGQNFINTSEPKVLKKKRKRRRILV